MADIRTFQSRSQDAREAVRELHAGISQADAAFVVFFCAPSYDRDALAEEINRLFAGVPVVGCTTAGEIGPEGYCEGSLTGASFPKGLFDGVAGRIGNLHEFSLGDGQAAGQELMHRLEAQSPRSNQDNSFALLLIDGLSMREEQVTRALQHAIGRAPLVGGSAGDGLRFQATFVFHDGAFHTDSAVVLLASTILPFKAFKSQHFRSTDRRLVVTEADTATRTVFEINGMPAADEYARMVGMNREDLCPDVFAKSPVVVVIDGGDYVRSIQKANPDGSLTFYCAIESGLVLRIANGHDLLDGLRQTLGGLSDDVGPLSFVFGSDCILRRLEVLQGGLCEEVSEVFKLHKTVGFSTYGEQFGGVHVNQTLTGLAFGQGPEDAVA